MAADEGFDPEEIERRMQDQDSQNQYLKQRNFALEEAAQGAYLPKQDSNVIEFKLDSEDLLERLEHYLRGDILKSRINERGEEETYYGLPSKKINVTLYFDSKENVTYIVDESDPKQWIIKSVLAVTGEGENQKEERYEIQENYQAALLEKLQKNLKGKNPKAWNVGYATYEIADDSKRRMTEEGVNDVMADISALVNKNTTLSYYEKDRIKEVLFYLGKEIKRSLLVNQKHFVMKSTVKSKVFIVIMSIIESAYRRALNGNENRGTREGISIVQSQPMGNQPPTPLPKKKWSPFNKASW